MWDATNGKEMASVRLEHDIRHRHVFSSDGRRVALFTLEPISRALAEQRQSEIGKLRVFEVVTGKEVFAFPASFDARAQITASSDGKWIAVADANGKEVAIYDATNGQEKSRLQIPVPIGKYENGLGRSYFALSVDATKLAFGYSGNPVTEIWDTLTGSQLHGSLGI